MNANVAFLDSASWLDEAALLEHMRWLRDNDPVHWSETEGLWLISRYEDVEYCSKHQELFTSGQGVRPGNPAKIGLIDEEEPRHGQLRGLINRGFSPRMVGKLEEVFRDLTKQHVDAIANASECDFVESVSVPLPLKLIAAMIGIREEDYDQFYHWSDMMILAEGNMGDPEVVAKAGQAYTEYAAYVTPIIEARRSEPQDDLLSILTGAKDEGLLKMYDEQSDVELAIENTEIANDELIKLLVILMVAGNETTRNGISSGMQLLIENPDQRQRLLNEPSLLNSAIEEMLRVASPVRSFGRTVVQDTELHGRQLKQGQTLLMLYPSANRDERVYDEADAFRVDRNPQHLGFGIGNHFCLGANLARMEMRVVFEEVLRRLPDMEYASGGPVFYPSALVRSCTEMKVRYTPERRAAA